MDQKLSLHDFLKLLTSNDVSVAKAMAVASKVFKEHDTPALLAQLDDAKLQVLGIKDKDLRRLFLAAVRKTGYTRRNRKSELDGDSHMQPVAGARTHSGTMQTTITPKKKRKHDDISNEFLPAVPPGETLAFGSMEFHDVLDEELLKVKSTVVNRAPLMTAWATIVAERLGFDREEALSIGSVYTEMNAVAKGTSLGIIDQSRRKEVEPISGGQPYVDLMGRRSLYRTQLSKWRALVNGSPALPSTAFSYISGAFRQTTPYMIGALRLLAESYTPQELNTAGFSLYADFRPALDGWGKKGEVWCARILSLRKNGGMTGARASDVESDDRERVPEFLGGHPLKKARTSCLQEHEAVVDEDVDFGKEKAGKLS